MCDGKITFNRTVVQRFLERVCLSNGHHHLAEFARGQTVRARFKGELKAHIHISLYESNTLIE